MKLTLRATIAGALASLLLTTAVLAHDYKVGDLGIDHPWIRATPKGAKNAGGYMKITNNGSEADILVGGSVADAKIVEVHYMAVEDNVMRMRKLKEGLEIKAGETVELKPGSFHVMMMGLDSGYEDGKKVSGTLNFEKAGTVEVEFTVRKAGETSNDAHGDDHSAHGEHHSH
ncbi:MAG: copper chaperone PCu(A)C [Hyphomicrobiales bacterium]|nr:copper chaperone PCu(A)C [Hyphomicrobiales bacterium]